MSVKIIYTNKEGKVLYSLSTRLSKNQIREIEREKGVVVKAI